MKYLNDSGLQHLSEIIKDRTKHLSNGDTVYPYASEIEIDDALGVNVKDLKVKITAQQDLHGYDKPWAGGAGKNLLPMTVDRLKAINNSGTWNGNIYSFRGVTFTVMTDNSNNVVGIKLDGTSNIEGGGSDSFRLIEITELNQILDGDYIVNGCPSGGSTTTYRISVGSSGRDVGSGTNVTTPLEGNRVAIFFNTNITFSNTIFYPMIRLATETDPTFEPYSNECPIIGWDECEIDVVGKNLWDSNEYYLGFVDATNYLKGSATAKSAIIPCKPNTTYTIYKPIGNRFRLCYTNEYPATGVRHYGYVDASWTDSYSITTGDEAKYIIAFVYTAADASYTYTWEDVQNSLMVVKGSTVPSVYEPYKGKTYTIDLDGIRYGGVIDLTKGVIVMTVDRASVDLGTLTWSRISTSTQGKYRFQASASPEPKLTASNLDVPNVISSQYIAISPSATYACTDGVSVLSRLSTSGTVMVYDDTLSQYSTDDFKTAMSGVQLVYELAEPFTIQLTPQQIQLLDGYNYLTANTGDIQVTTTDINGAIGQADKILNEISPRVYSIIGADNAGFHNSIYRGRYLGNHVTDSQYDAIDTGTFEDLFIGDYWTINGVNWRIAHFDYWLNTGDTSTTKHHVVIVPDTNLYNAQMNTTNTVSGGYYNSAMRGGDSYTDPTNGGNIKTAYATISSAFGEGHILQHRERLTNNVSASSGNSSGCTWCDSTVELMSDVMVNGSLSWLVGMGYENYEVGIDKGQFSLFRLNHAIVPNNSIWWLRTIANSNFITMISSGFMALSGGVSSYGVRPCFGIIKQ